MLKNALEASEPGQTITMSCQIIDHNVRFQVHNTAYIRPEIQMQIFLRSFSTKGSNRGLGTYSMRLLSERYLKGKVWFTSSREDGTRFYASYPL
jgi:sensor histidine kinase regulating citrate/malate metabolism